MLCLCTSEGLSIAISVPPGNAGRHELRFTTKRDREEGEEGEDEGVEEEEDEGRGW